MHRIQIQSEDQKSQVILTSIIFQKFSHSVYVKKFFKLVYAEEFHLNLLYQIQFPASCSKIGIERYWLQCSL